jgi:signal transduction histidine kinase
MGIQRWLTVAGFVTWIVSGLPTFLRIVHGNMNPSRTIVFAIAFPLFGVAFGLMCLERPGIWQRTVVRRTLIALQSSAGLAMTSTASDVFPAGTLVVVAGQLDELPPRAAVIWMIVQTVAIARIGFTYVNSIVAWTIGLAFAGFQLFAYVMASLASRERHAREQLTRAHHELLATRALLAESSRNEERLRISRDLHDTLGHHLTALSLQLDVASRLTNGKASEHVRQAHAITRLLLSDVREVVSELRGNERSEVDGSGRIDLNRAIRSLAVDSSALTIHLDLPAMFEIKEGARADALLKCVQEIITNTRRHAAARQLRITVTSDADGITLHARDDGRGVTTIDMGHGLTGMRERFEALGGRIEFHSGDGRGFELHGVLPAQTTAS